MNCSTMQKIRTFRHAFRHSLVPLDDYYKRLRKNPPLAFSLKYLLGLAALVALVYTSVTTISFVSAYPPQKLQTMLTSIQSSYPDNLVITVNDNGRLTSNYDRPYTMFIDIDGVPTSVFTVDPKAQPEQIAAYDSRLLVKEQEMVVLWNNRVVPIPFEKNSFLRIDQEKFTAMIQSLIDLARSYYPIVIVAFGIAFISLALFFFMSKVVYLALVSLIVFLVGIQFIQKLTLEKTYQIGLHASTGPILLEMVAIIFNLNIPIPFWYLITTIVFVFAAVYESYLAPAGKKDV